MNRFQITADVDVTLWLGVLTKYKRQSNKIEYTNLEELFESENVYFPTRDELSRFEVHTGSSAFLEDVCTY